MYEFKKIGKVFTSKFVGSGPSSYKKSIYRAAVLQRLRNTDLQCQTVSKNMLQGWTFKTFKTSGNCGYLIKRPSGRQCVKELFIYWCNFVAENFEPLRTLTGVKNWTHWHSLTSAKWTFFYFAVKLYPLLYSECSETRLIWIFLLLWNLKTGMLLFPAAEHQILWVLLNLIS